MTTLCTCSACQSRFYINYVGDGSYAVRDRNRGDCVLTFLYPSGSTGVSPQGGPWHRDDARDWARALNLAVDDVPAGVFWLAGVTGKPTAATREVVDDVLAGEVPIVLPWMVVLDKPAAPPVKLSGPTLPTLALTQGILDGTELAGTAYTQPGSFRTSIRRETWMFFAGRALALRYGDDQTSPGAEAYVNGLTTRAPSREPSQDGWLQASYPAPEVHTDGAGTRFITGEHRDGWPWNVCADCGAALVDDDRAPLYDAESDDGTAHNCVKEQADVADALD